MLSEKTAQALRGLTNVERQPLFFFWRSVFVWELSSSSGWGDVWPFRKGDWALFTSFIALLLTVWEVCSGRFYTLVRLRFVRMSWDHSLAWLLQQRVSCYLNKYTVLSAAYSAPSNIPHFLMRACPVWNYLDQNTGSSASIHYESVNKCSSIGFF